MNAIDFGKGALKVATHPATLTIVAGSISCCTAYIGYKAAKANAEAAKAQHEAVILQAKMGGYDEMIADAFLKDKVKAAVEEEMKKYKKEEAKEETIESDKIIKIFDEMANEETQNEV